jgi:hypothetical protein
MPTSTAITAITTSSSVSENPIRPRRTVTTQGILFPGARIKPNLPEMPHSIPDVPTGGDHKETPIAVKVISADF